MSTQVQIVDERATTHATGADYCKLFAEEMHGMYLLAFLLTADKDKAEQCFVGGFGECVERIGVFMESARSWARRTLVKHAIQMIGPAPDKGVEGFFVSAKWKANSGTSNPFSVIVSLGAFERFVFVMSVLEGQSDEDCQSLLGCSRQEFAMAREVALRVIAAANPGWEHAQAGKHLWLGQLN
jgi:hypothetical protein